MGKKRKQKIKHPALHRLNRWWLRYEYKHTTIAAAVFFVFVLLFDTAFLSSVFHYLNDLGYLGGLIGGALSASLITAAPALVLILELAQHLDPLTLALMIGIGSSLGDLLLLIFFEERIFTELAPLGRKLKLDKLVRRQTHKRRPSTVFLLLGAFLIMTPLPDEVGLGMLGISRFPRVFLFVVCLALNTLGAALLISGVRAVVG